MVGQYFVVIFWDFVDFFMCVGVYCVEFFLIGICIGGEYGGIFWIGGFECGFDVFYLDFYIDWVVLDMWIGDGFVVFFYLMQ